MDRPIDIIEEEITQKFHEQITRKNSYSGKASLVMTAQTLVLNVAINMYISIGNIDAEYLKVILAFAIIGIACAGYTALAPKYEYDAPNIEKILDEYDDLKCAGDEKKVLRLREKIVRAKAKAISRNGEKMEKTNTTLMGVSFACMILELIIVFIR